MIDSPRVTSRAERLHTLDAMRGLAAGMVVAYHVTGPSSGTVPLGYLAVDFFFILSGLVISRAFDDRIANGMTFMAFVRVRLVRLYPMFFLGLLLDTARKSALIVSGRADFTWIEVVTALAREAMFVPSSPTHGVLFWVNPPAWSLVLELVVNAAFAMWLVRLKTSTLAAIGGLSLACFAGAASGIGTFDLGPEWATVIYGLIRAFFGFVVGMLLARLNAVRAIQSWRVVPLCFCLIAIFFAPRSFWIELLCIACVLPTIVLLGQRWQPPAHLTAVFRVLGEVSYPMYAIHWALMFGIAGFLGRSGVPAMSANVLTVFIIAALAYLVGRAEAPARRRLAVAFGR